MKTFLWASATVLAYVVIFSQIRPGLDTLAITFVALVVAGVLNQLRDSFLR